MSQPSEIHVAVDQARTVTLNGHEGRIQILPEDFLIAPGREERWSYVGCDVRVTLEPRTPYELSSRCGAYFFLSMLASFERDLRMVVSGPGAEAMLCCIDSGEEYYGTKIAVRKPTAATTHGTKVAKKPSTHSSASPEERGEFVVVGEINCPVGWEVRRDQELKYSGGDIAADTVRRSLVFNFPSNKQCVSTALSELEALVKHLRFLLSKEQRLGEKGADPS